MRLHGFCEACHRIRLVTVSSAGLALLARGGTAVGTCDACEDDPDHDRRIADHRRATGA